MKRSTVFAFLWLFLFLTTASRPWVKDRYPWPHQSGDASLMERFPPPSGYHLLPVSQNSFGKWLRKLPLKVGLPDIYLYNGFPTFAKDHVAVVDLDVGRRDLQQCADTVIRLRAEYLWSQGRSDEISFHFTSGDVCSWKRWRLGWRPRVKGSLVRWSLSAPARADRKNFGKYLHTVFSYAGTYSLDKETARVNDPSQIRDGDFFIQGGFPGHTVMAVGVAENEKKQRVFMLLEGYTPAQDAHILKNGLGGGKPWFKAGKTGMLRTPRWTFRHIDLHRFQTITPR